MPTLFISCVSNEFGNYREAFRKEFDRANLQAKIQEDFPAYGGSTMEKLDHYIQQSVAIIHICGDMPGSMANKRSLEYIHDKYKDFAARLPALKPVLDDNIEASYTQWEAYLAAYHNKKVFVVKPADELIRGDNYKKDEKQIAHQSAHLELLKKLGYHPEITFTNKDQLIAELYRSQLGDILNAIPNIKPVNLPYHSIGNAFKGREDFIKDVHETLNNTTGIAAIAIHALGGMGKTRLAVEYGWQYKNDYTALLFVNANSPELFITNIAGLAEPKILNLPEHKAQEEEAKYNAVINWLNQYTGWLLVLDNVDTTQVVKNLRHFLSTLQHGHVIITSRINNWASPLKDKQLKILDEGSAVTFLMESTNEKRRKKAGDEATAQLLANDVGYLALALDQARSYINTNEISFENYRSAWQANRKAVLAWYDELQTDYPASVAITWQTSFNQLSTDAVTLLNRLCWLAPEPIPKTLLEVELPGTANINAPEAWAQLKQYSLATSTEDKTAFTIHKLVQEITKSKMDETLQTQTLIETLDWINEAFVGDANDVRTWPYLEPLIPHVLSLVEYAQLNEMNEATSRLMNDVALIFINKAQYNTAEPLIRRAIEIFKESRGENHPSVATSLNNLAQLFQATNRLQEAEPLMRKALEIDTASFGENHPNVARDLNNLAQLLNDTNRLQEAEPLMRKALEIDKANFGENHLNVARVLNNLATLLQATNRLQEAEPLMRKVIEIFKASLGENHPNVAISLNNLAILLHDTNRLQEAEPVMYKALEIDRASLGENHPNVAIRLNNLAQLLKDTNRLQEAEPLMRKALEIYKESLGEDHPNVAVSLNNLALLLQDTNRLQEAEPLMRKALEIYKESLGEDHPNVASSLNDLALLLQDTNRLPEAEPLMRKAFIIFNTSLGINHPNTQTVGNNYISLLEDLGKSEKEIQDILSSLLQ